MADNFEQKGEELNKSLEGQILELIDLPRVVILEDDEDKYLIEYEGQQEFCKYG